MYYVLVLQHLHLLHVLQQLQAQRRNPLLASVASSTNEEKKEEVATEGKYDVTNNTGKEVKELYFYDATGTDKGENYAKDGLADGATVTVNVNVDEDKAEGYAMKVEYVTEDGDDVVVFESLH